MKMVDRVRFQTAKAAAGLLTVVVCLVGCSSVPDDQPELVDVEGRVTMDGQPLAGAAVSFEPVDGRRGAAGSTDEDGRYFLTYVRSVGCPLGEHNVSITTRKEILDEYGGAVGMEPEQVPARYHGQNSELSAVVTADGQNTFNFDLSSSGAVEEL